MKIIRIFAASILIVFSLCCKKDKTNSPQIRFDQDGLPRASNDGLNVLGYEYDSKSFYIQKFSSQDALKARLVDNHDKSFSFELSSAIKRDSTKLSLYITLDSTEIEVGKKIELTDRNLNKKEAYATLYLAVPHPVFAASVSIYESFGQDPGFIMFNYHDKEKRILSGVFEVNVKASFFHMEPQFMRIKKGRFDVKYSPHRPIML